jgi:hypothetical protein
MNLGDRINCGRLAPTHIGLSDKRVQSILANSVDVTSISISGAPLAYSDLANTPTVDASVTASSSNLISSGAVETAIATVTSNTSNMYAPVASPTFTGTITAPVLHATTIQLNGADVATSIAINTAKVGITSAQANAIAVNTEKISYPGPQSWSEVTSKPNLQEAITVSNTTSSTFGDNTYLFGGLDLTSGTLTYIPQPIAGIYAPLSGPTFTGTVALPSSTSIGNVSATELGHLNGVSSSIQTQFANLSALVSGKQLALEAPVVAAASGTGNIALTSNTGYNTLLTYTPPAIAGVYAPISGPTFTGTVGLPSTTSIGDVSTTEIGYLNGVTSAIQTQINNKASLSGASFTGMVQVGGIVNLIGTGSGTVHCRSFGPPVVYDHVNVTSNRRLYLSGSHGIYAQGSLHVSSDDRLKYNESSITNALDTLMKLSPQLYDKMPCTFDQTTDTWTGLDTPFDASRSKTEAGFIAQEVLAIPELESAVLSPEDSTREAYALNYDHIFTYAVAAIQELATKVASLEARIVVAEG